VCVCLFVCAPVAVNFTVATLASHWQCLVAQWGRLACLRALGSPGVCLGVWLFVCLFVCVCVCFYVGLFVCLCVCARLFVCLFMFVCLRTSGRFLHKGHARSTLATFSFTVGAPSLSSGPRQPGRLFVCLFVCVCLFVSLYACLFAYVCVCVCVHLLVCVCLCAHQWPLASQWPR
jgi:hypothetical protein